MGLRNRRTRCGETVTRAAWLAARDVSRHVSSADADIEGVRPAASETHRSRCRQLMWHGIGKRLSRIRLARNMNRLQASRLRSSARAFRPGLLFAGLLAVEACTGVTGAGPRARAGLIRTAQKTVYSSQACAAHAASRARFASTCPPRGPRERAMKATFLGTNGWFDTKLARTVSTLISADDFDLVLDAGSGFFALDEHCRCDKPLFVFLSHFHLDHIHGLHSLAKLKPRHGIHFIVPPGGEKTLRLFLAHPFTKPIEDLGYRVTITEATEQLRGFPFEARALAMVHSTPTVGIRVQHGGSSFAYCPDTGYCPNAVDLGTGVGLLVTECAFPPGASDPKWPHLNPETAARIALEASARDLVLTHFDAAYYPEREDRIAAQRVARAVFPKTRAAFDGLEVSF
jgi:ribonuclease BN (tRNA processing enzyme)